jgi:hypothetical protein
LAVARELQLFFERGKGLAVDGGFDATGMNSLNQSRRPGGMNLGVNAEGVARNGMVYIPLAVLAAPIGISLALWIMQQVLSIFSVGTGYVLALGLSGAALAASMQYFSLGHDLHSLAETGRKIAKDDA